MDYTKTAREIAEKTGITEGYAEYLLKTEKRDFSKKSDEEIKETIIERVNCLKGLGVM